MDLMGLGDDGLRQGRRKDYGAVGETLFAAVIFAVAMGFTWVSQGGDEPVELAAPTGRTATNHERASATIPPSQPATAVSFTPTGEIVRPAPVVARIIDPETGQEVLVPLPPGTTVVAGEVVPVGSTGTTPSGGTATTTPGTGTTGTTSGGSPTTAPPTTETPTTETPTTETPTTETPTTETPTTETPTTETPTTETPTTEPPQGIVGG
jgi:hypothetical protein